MATKQDLQEWIIEALMSLGGSAVQIDVAKEIWRRHQADLEGSDDLFYTWQYDFRGSSNLTGQGGSRR